MSRDSKKTKTPLTPSRYVSTDIIEIHDSDSDYESGSMVSSPSRLSPTEETRSVVQPKLECVDIDDSENDHETDKKRPKRKKILVYANVNRNAFLPWRICRYLRCSVAADDVKHDAFIEIDSDNEDTVRTIPINDDLNATMNSNCTIKDFDALDDNCDEAKYHIVESRHSTIGVKRIPAYYIARYNEIGPDIKLAPKMRVIARRKSSRMPYTTTQSSDIKHFIHTNEKHAFYAGIIGCHSLHRDNQPIFLVFFDDGHVQYVSQRNIRLVFGSPGYKHVHPNAKKFCEYYFDGPEKDLVPEIKGIPGQNIVVYLNGHFENACIKNIRPKGSDAPKLVHLYFEKWNRYEWIYTGSPRIEKNYRFTTKKKSLWQFHPGADETTCELSSGSEDEDEQPILSIPRIVGPSKTSVQDIYELDVARIVPNYKAPKQYQRHKCTNQCTGNLERDAVIYQYARLDRPILCGWKRQKVNGKFEYTAPCGRSHKGIAMISKYLKQMDSRLTVDCFSFDKRIRCMHEKRTIIQGEQNDIPMMNDLIPGGDKESMHIPVISITGNYPNLDRYVTDYYRNPRSKKLPRYLQERAVPFRSCCDCIDNCANRDKCQCWQLTRSSGRYNNKRCDVGYNNKRLLDKVQYGIYECNSDCKCNIQCSNRVVTKQIGVKLEVFETVDRGYGVRTQTDLPQGTFICCYFGDLIHGKTADLRGNRSGDMMGDEYFVTLDHIEMAEHKPDYESDVLFDSDDENPTKIQKLNTPSQSDTRTPQKKCNPIKPTYTFINYFPTFSKKETVDVTRRTELFGEDEEAFVVDGRRRGNISRFFNHSCDPNCFPQTVFVDNHDLRFPYVALFTIDTIKAGTELTWDYGYVVGSVKGREVICRCGAKSCRGRLL